MTSTIIKLPCSAGAGTAPELLDTGIGKQPPGVPPTNTNTEPSLPRLVRISIAAKVLGCSVVTVRRLVRKGALRHYRRHGRLMFDVRDLRLWLEAQRVELHEVVTIDLEPDEVVVIDPEPVSTKRDI